MKIGCVGKPSSGKTTFLNAATLVNAETASYTFTTIKPNQGTAFVRTKCPCQEFDVECNPRNSKCINGTRMVPVTLIDVAGLVPGAHEGKGMGNQFLSDLTDADALIHVVDASGRTDEKGEPTENHNPVKDIDFLEEEIDYWILDIIKKDWDKLERMARTGDVDIGKYVYERVSGLKVSEEIVKKIVKRLEITPSSEEEELFKLSKKIREENKPIMVAANKMDLPESENNFDRMKEKAGHILPCCAEAELALREAEEQGLIDYFPGESSFKIVEDVSGKKKKGLEFIRGYLDESASTGVQEVIDRTVFDLLDMIVVYPVEKEKKLSDRKGNVLPDALLIKKGSTALDLAEKIHSDIAEEFKGAIDCRTGRRVGKKHKLKNNDIIKILV